MSIFFGGPTIEGVSSPGRKNSNAFIKTIREQETHSKEWGVRGGPLQVSPSTLEARGAVSMCVCVDGCVHVRVGVCVGWWALQRRPTHPPSALHVSGAGKWRGPHQRAVLTPPAWKLRSDKRPGSSKGGGGGGGAQRGGQRVKAAETRAGDTRLVLVTDRRAV